MNVLLDTHAFLWFLADDEALSVTARRVIAAPQNQIFVSLVSGWEIAIKKKIGKLTFPEPFEDCFRQGCSTNGFQVLALAIEHIGATLRLPLHHRDPFDRLLLAQCQVAGLTFLSRDESLDAYSIPRAW